MTLTAPPTTQMWSTMPGWGITANLLPPEVVAARRLGAIRKMIVAVMILVVVLGGLGYGYALLQQHSARDDLSSEQARTTALLAQQRTYAEVVALAGTISQIKDELATLMAGDVDAAKLVDAIVARLPTGAAITQLQATLAQDLGQTNSSTTSTGVGVLDTSGRTHVGSVSVTATLKSMQDGAAFATQLATIPGVIDVYPTSQTNNSGSIQITIQMILTDQLLTHRFDVTPADASTTGGK